MATDTELLDWLDTHPCTIDSRVVEGTSGLRIVWLTFQPAIKCHDRLRGAIAEAMQAERGEEESDG